MSVQPLTIVTVTYNSSSVIGALLESVRGVGAEIIVVDNGSSDDTLAIAAGYPHVRIIKNANSGYGRAANLGFAAANTPYVLLANPDVVFSAGAIEAMVASAESHPDIAILSANIFERDNGKKHFLRSYDFDAEGLATTDWVVGAVMFMRRDVIQKLGGFDENIFLFYEETDLCLRAVKAGYRIAVVRAAEAQHEAGSSSGESVRVAGIKAWHAAWSKAYYHRKHFSRLTYARKCISGVVNSVRRMGVALLLCNMREYSRHRHALLGWIAGIRGESAFENGAGKHT